MSINLQGDAASDGDAAGDQLDEIEGVIGSAFNDSLSGSLTADTLIGGAGDDIITSNGGADVLDGGAGVDMLNLAFAGNTGGVSVNLTTNAVTVPGGDSITITGFENVTGTGFGDVFTGDSGANTLLGFGGDDVLAGLAGADTLTGGAGSDTVDYSASGAAVTVSLVTQTATGGDATGDVLSGFERVIGSAFNDLLTGDGVANVLSGGGGDDLLGASGASDTLDGGDGIDTASYSAAGGGVSVNLTIAGPQATGIGFHTLTAIENLSGSAFNDTLTGDANANVLTGGAGTDTLNGGDGDDALAGLAGADALNGGAGVDTADYSASGAGVTIDLSTNAASGGDADGDSLSNIENAIGSGLNDTLTGNGGANVLDGRRRRRRARRARWRRHPGRRRRRRHSRLCGVGRGRHCRSDGANRERRASDGQRLVGHRECNRLGLRRHAHWRRRRQYVDRRRR